MTVQWLSSMVPGDGSASEQLGLIWLIVLIACVAALSGMTQLHYLSEIVTQSAHDPLTKAYNRMTGEEFMEKYFAKESGRNRYCDGSQSDAKEMAAFIKIGA